MIEIEEPRTGFVPESKLLGLPFIERKEVMRSA